jgi:hypothetical protein
MLQIVVNLPRENEISMETLDSFTPNENLVMLMVGMQAVKTIKENYVTVDTDGANDLFKTELFKKDLEKTMAKSFYDVSLREERERHAEMLIEKTASEKHKLSLEYKQIIDTYDKGNNKYEEKIDKLNETIFLVKNEFTELQIEFAKKNERDTLRDLHLDNEINIKIKNKEDEMNKDMDKLKESLHSYKLLENDKILNLNLELNEAKTKLKDFIINQEIERSLMLKESLEKSMLENSKINTNKSNSRGAIGEQMLNDMMKQTFGHFEHFDIVDKSKIPHSGDMWLYVNSMTIMLDAKNYKDFVPKSEINKLKKDMEANPSIKIAWLISMETNISNYGHAPYVIDVENGIIYCYINSLMLLNDPEKILTTAYYQCKFVYDKIINIKSEDNILENLEKNEKRIKTTLQKMLDNSKARYNTLDNLKSHFLDIDNELRNCLNDEFKVFDQKNTDIVLSWWNKNTVKNITNKKRKLETNDIYKKFVSSEENKNCGIDNDMMKKILKDNLNSDEFKLGGMTEKSQLFIFGYEYNN